MIVEKSKYKVKCDFYGCHNESCYSFSKNGEMPLNMCESCAKELVEDAKKQFTPKAIEAPFKKMKKIRSEK